MEGEKVGVLNRLFGYVYQIRLLGKRIKQWHRTVYYALKWMLILGVVVPAASITARSHRNNQFL